jgi:hypothetical protein
MPYYVERAKPDEGWYDIEESDKGFRWIWSETVKGVEHPSCGDWRATRSAALTDAADDWEDNGSPSMNRRLAGTLRGLATRAALPGTDKEPE